MAPSAQPSSSSARPVGPLSDAISNHEEQVEGFNDDEIPRSSRMMGTDAVPKVEDRVGLLVQEHFEQFIEK
jgi:DNA replication licensing factor MCM6